jgi:putative DNA primase/helicase
VDKTSNFASQSQDRLSGTPCSREAQRLRKANFWVIAIYPRGSKFADGRVTEGKEPIGKEWGLKQQASHQLRYTYDRYRNAGVGITLGPGRAPDGGWLADIEGDGPEAEESWLKLTGGEEISTMSWGSVRGQHRLLRLDETRMLKILPGLKSHETKKPGQPGVYHFDALPGLELRLGGYKDNGVVKQLQSVVPPTEGTDGNPRVWTGGNTVAEAPESSYAVLEAIVPTNGATNDPPPDPKANGQDSHWGGKAHGRPDDVTRARAYLAKCEPAIQGEDGSGRCFKAACKIGPGFDLSQDVTVLLLLEIYNPTCVPPWSEKEIRHKVEDAYKNELRRGFLRDEPPPRENTNEKAKAKSRPKEDPEPTDYSKLTDEELGILPLVDVVEEPIKWLWPYRLEVGGLALMAGDAGIGKSQVLLKAAAIVSNGGAWPGGEGQAPKGNVVIVSAEDRPERTIRPRLRAMGAHVDRITIIKAKVIINKKNQDGTTAKLISFMTFQDRDYWKTVFDRIGSVVLFIADPLPSYLGRSVNDSRNLEIRAVLEPFLDEVIWPRDICMWGNTHLNKQIDHKTPLHRVSGSVAYGALPRNVHFIVRDAENPLRRYFKQAKCNDAPDDLHALPFQIEEREIIRQDGLVIKIAVPVFEEEGVKIDLTETMNPKKGRTENKEKRERLRVWLVNELKDGPVESDEIKRRATAAGFGQDMLWEVKGELGVKAQKYGMNQGWSWYLSPKQYHDASDASGG